MEKIQVCIVEDNSDLRFGMKMILDNCEDIQCIGDFPNAEEALTFMHQKKPDVVLMDINLPGMNGIEAIYNLKTLCPETQFLMITVLEDDDMIFKSLQAGATGYLLKKSSVSQIAQAVLDIHNGGSPMSPGIARKVLAAFQNRDVPGKPDYMNLSEREIEIVNLLAKGYRYKEIADLMCISQATVRTHIYNIYQKLHVQSRTDALNKIFK